MYKTTSIQAIAVLGILALNSASAIAEDILTTDGLITVTPGTVSPGEVGVYDSGGDGLVGIAASWPSGPSPAVAASNIDHYWLQGDPPIIWSFSSAQNSVLAIAGVDHDPIPQENLEFIIWGSNDKVTWEEGKILAIYRDGVDPSTDILGIGQSDDYSSLWGFTTGYSYVRATSGDHLVPAYGSAGEFEIDGVARPAGVPDSASTGLLLSIGLVGLGLLRRKTS